MPGLSVRQALVQPGTQASELLKAIEKEGATLL